MTAILLSLAMNISTFYSSSNFSAGTVIYKPYKPADTLVKQWLTLNKFKYLYTEKTDLIIAPFSSLIDFMFYYTM